MAVETNHMLTIPERSKLMKFISHPQFLINNDIIKSHQTTHNLEQKRK